MLIYILILLENVLWNFKHRYETCLALHLKRVTKKPLYNSGFFVLLIQPIISKNYFPLLFSLILKEAFTYSSYFFQLFLPLSIQFF